jgi:hypothetical protein
LSELNNETELIFEPLDSNHDRAAFSCGVPQLDTYLKTQASQDVRKNIGAVFVLTPDHKRIDGYYSLSQYSIDLGVIPEELARKLTKHSEIPATLIGRLARSLQLAGTGTGELILMNALTRILDISRQVASWAVIVDAKDDKAIKFYQKYGFIVIPTAPNRLFMTMDNVAKLF